MLIDVIFKFPLAAINISSAPIHGMKFARSQQI